MATSGSVQTNHIAAISRKWYWELVWNASYNGNTATVSWEIYARCESGTSGSTMVANYGFSGNVHNTNLSYGSNFYKDSKIASGSFSLSGGQSFNVNITAHPYSGSYTSSGSWNFTLDNNVVTPTVTCSITSRGLNTIKASMSVTNNGNAGIVDRYIDLFIDSGCKNIVGTINGSSGTFSGLSPNKTYYARANASNGTYRGYSSVVKTSTYDIAKISSVGNFEHGSNASVVITNPASISSLSLVMKIGSTKILSRTVKAGTNTIVFSDTELDNIYKKYGSSNTLTATFSLSGSGYTNSKNATITLKGNQKTIKVKVSNNWKRGKVFIKISNTWKKAIVWKNINGVWKRGI